MDKKYAPIIRKGRIIEEQANRSSFSARRAEGQTHIDLWVDGSLYLVDPATNSASEFRTTKQYLEFLCHDESGMLGYCESSISLVQVRRPFYRFSQHPIA